MGAMMSWGPGQMPCSACLCPMTSPSLLPGQPSNCQSLASCTEHPLTEVKRALEPDVTSQHRWVHLLVLSTGCLCAMTSRGSAMQGPDAEELLSQGCLVHCLSFHPHLSALHALMCQDSSLLNTPSHYGNFILAHQQQAFPRAYMTSTS